MADLRVFFYTLLSAVLAIAGYHVIQSKPSAATPPPVTTPSTPPTAPKPKPEPKPDTQNAIARIQFGSAGCTATVIGAKREDGRYDVLTAAHCINGVGQRGTMKLKDGRTLGVQVVALDRRADACWLLTDSSTETLPFALLADEDPAPGTRIWHAGYGVHIPGNREDGVIVATSNGDGQIQFRLSVSSGDSGGGICVDETGRIVSTVCCTTAKGQVADVWGAGPAAIRRTKQMASTPADEWTPIEVPLVVPSVMPPAK